MYVNHFAGMKMVKVKHLDAGLPDAAEGFQ